VDEVDEGSVITPLYSPGKHWTKMRMRTRMSATRARLERDSCGSTPWRDYFTFADVSFIAMHGGL
jgi:hypothetical protein